MTDQSSQCSPCACRGPELQEDPEHGWPVGDTHRVRNLDQILAHDFDKLPLSPYSSEAC